MSSPTTSASTSLPGTPPASRFPAGWGRARCSCRRPARANAEWSRRDQGDNGRRRGGAREHRLHGVDDPLPEGQRRDLAERHAGRHGVADRGERTQLVDERLGLPVLGAARIDRIPDRGVRRTAKAFQGIVGNRVQIPDGGHPRGRVAVVEQERVEDARHVLPAVVRGVGRGERPGEQHPRRCACGGCDCALLADGPPHRLGACDGEPDLDGTAVDDRTGGSAARGLHDIGHPRIDGEPQLEARVVPLGNVPRCDDGIGDNRVPSLAGQAGERGTERVVDVLEPGLHRAEGAAEAGGEVTGTITGHRQADRHRDQIPLGVSDLCDRVPQLGRNSRSSARGAAAASAAQASTVSATATDAAGLDRYSRPSRPGVLRPLTDRPPGRSRPSREPESVLRTL